MEAKERLIKDEMSEKILETAARLALSQGVRELSVKKIIQHLGVTNRVFYNRFHNMEEVLFDLYQTLARKMRESLFDLDGQKDYFEQIVEMAAQTLKLSYRLKLGLNEFVFFQDCLCQENFSWWKEQICQLIDLGKKKDLVKADLDADKISYAIWCFIRGYNTDALGRKLEEKQAVEGFVYAFRMFLEGMKKRA